MKNNKRYDDIFNENEINNIRNDYKNGLSIKKIGEKYGIKSNLWIRKKIDDIVRNFSEANKMSHSLYPNSFKHNKRSIEKIRQARIKFMKEHPEQTAWRKRNKPSYPEKCFIKYLKERKIDEKYEIEREKPFPPYFADFAFNEIKLVVEIDGSQHILDDKRIENDNKKDELIRNLGWKVIRYTEDVVKHDWALIDKTLILEDFEKIEPCKRYGIFKTSKKYYKKVVRESNGLSKKQNDLHFNQRRCVWPTKEELFELIKKHSFTEIGRQYGVSDKGVVRWCKRYSLPYKKSELKKIKL